MEEKNKSGDSLWNDIVRQVKMLLPTELERNRMDRLFPLMHSPKLEENLYVIEVGEQIQVEMFTNLYSKLILEALQTFGINVGEVRFVVGKDITTVQQQQPQFRHTVQNTPQRGVPSTMPMQQLQWQRDQEELPTIRSSSMEEQDLEKRISWRPLVTMSSTNILRCRYAI